MTGVGLRAECECRTLCFVSKGAVLAWLRFLEFSECETNSSVYTANGTCTLITFSCSRRQAFLGRVRARNLFVRVLGEGSFQ